MTSETFETLGKEYDSNEDVLTLVKQINEELIPDHAGYGFVVKAYGDDKICVAYHTYEVGLGDQDRRKYVEELAEKGLRDWAKIVKNEFKSRSKRALKLKEVKAERTQDVQKVSLNDRYYYILTFVYEI